MSGPMLIGCALMVLLLLPVLVLDGERRPAGNGLYALIALGGLGFSTMLHGFAGLLLAAATGAACLLLLSFVVAALDARWRLRLLTGGHIKLLAAGATWLSATGALLMLVMTAGLFLAAALILRVRKAANPRPDMAAIAAVALLSARLIS